MFHDAIAIQLFVKLTDKLKTNIASKSDSVMGYSKPIIESRLLQEFSFLEMINFKSCTAKRYKTSKNKDDLNMGRIKSSRFIYSTTTGELSITNSYLVKKIMSFIIHWNSIVFIYIRSIFTGSKLNKVFTLVYGVRIEDELYLEFDEFCKYGSISPLRESEHLIVESFTKTNFSYNNTDYCNNPLHTLILKNKPSFSGFFSFLLSHIKYAILYFKSVVNYPLMAILKDDFLHQAMAISLNKKYLIKDIVITNSNMSRQLLWMSDLPNKTHNLHMVFYSQNKPFAFTFKEDGIVSAELYYRNIRVDETWVWTKYFANHLKSLGGTSIFHIVGPILWYLPVQEIPHKRNYINICVFDVLPHNAKTLAEIGYSNLYMYYSFENMSKFITDIIEVANTLEEIKNSSVRVILKQKRGRNKNHNDYRYLDFIDNLIDNGKIILFDHTSNIYSMISNSDVVINYPYTSTAYIADYVGIPAIFFDPTEELIPIYEESEGIEFASGKDDLASKLSYLLRNTHLSHSELRH
jgi:polysaccharide biosynthesis PFTS motif protein